MKITASPRSPEDRKRDVLARLERELDIWVASADADGVPCLVPLWFLWDGQYVWVSTRATNPTGRNLADGRRTRLAFADTRNVVLIDAEATAFTAHDVPAPAAEAFHGKYGWDPREDRAAYAFFRVRPLAVQAWHEQRELHQRHLMRDGTWLA